ncbi:hypothetical protein LAUMK35_05476 [Mycobacterium pseudokansasii]|nr:hypothetical protein LAUMK35_05476 [Mycobacterium pseudokansasii]VBA35030.1 hypothetical protein LAUMK21_05436 [Mycobacterium pseudokansasii]
MSVGSLAVSPVFPPLPFELSVLLLLAELALSPWVIGLSVFPAVPVHVSSLNPWLAVRLMASLPTLMLGPLVVAVLASTTPVIPPVIANAPKARLAARMRRRDLVRRMWPGVESDPVALAVLCG